MSFAPKLLMGGIALGGTSVGLGIEALTSSNSNKISSKGQSKEKTVAVNKDCRLHLLVSIGNGEFKLVTKDEMKDWIKKNGGNLESIEKACSENAGKDIFVSNKGGWDYRKNDQEDVTHKEKFGQYLNKLNSKQ
ncbi:hypothetical protein MHC_01995 [Mycoplasma haemocanis str. Illinois]|uniref:Uncharacterized protein n=1 Tax=Mycoplasma haemocanis (strain Illinois) TaxID=1111676 RepID=H6N6J3_MYCHN|nr:hypothetical protein [Mycoplasma haemocanis]AEW45265.1 hypothetical protein MHC_01995 [Mycoplasma haemocanis str. Illinois]